MRKWRILSTYSCSSEEIFICINEQLYIMHSLLIDKMGRTRDEPVRSRKIEVISMSQVSCFFFLLVRCFFGKDAVVLEVDGCGTPVLLVS